MKKAKQEVQALLQGSLHDIVAAVLIANNGNSPAPRDVADLMAAWGTIAKVVSQPRAAAHRAFTTAQLDMITGLMGEGE